MATRKRYRSDDGDNDQGEPTSKKAFLERAQPITEQRVVAEKQFGVFRLKIKLRSMSKALQNDPRPSSSDSELDFDRPFVTVQSELDLTTEMSKPSPESSQDSPDDHADASTHEATSTIDESTIDKLNGYQLHENPRPDKGKNEDCDDSREVQHINPPTESNHESDIDKGSLDEIDHSDADGYEDDSDEGDEEEEINEHDETRSEYCDQDYEFKWLEAIDVEVASPLTALGPDKLGRVAYCSAKLIRRGRIRDEFYAAMQQPSRETSMLAFDLFNRYGRLKPEYIEHPVKKGTGVWNQELNRGDILLIEEIFVASTCRRQRIGREMMDALLALVSQKSNRFFTFVWPAMLKLHDVGQEWDSLKDDAEKAKMDDRECSRAIAFYRSLGFRRVGSSIWFAMTSDHEHPSRQLASTEDLDLSNPPPTTLHSLLCPFQQINDPPLSELERILGRNPPPYPDFLHVLRCCFQEKGSDDSCWTSRDKNGDTILHLAATIYDVSCVEWIMQQQFGDRLLESRNHKGETPLECLESKLERLRTLRRFNHFTACISDQFTGHDKRAVECLGLLRRLDLSQFVSARGSTTIQRQLSGGCTCGQCLDGVLSPRMSHALLVQASVSHDWFDGWIDHMDGSKWVDFNETSLRFVPWRVRENLKTNKSMRQGLVSLWRHIATCIKEGLLPDQHNVLEALRDANEWPPATRNFLSRGGTVESAFLAICRHAMEQDEWMGDGSYQEDLNEEIAELPECRNDHEFGFVSGWCGYRRISLIHDVDERENTVDEDKNPINSQF